MSANQYKYRSIMLVDDNEIDNFINEKMIQASMFAENIYIHSSSKSGLEFLRNLENSKEKVKIELIPEYIFLDINMPTLDGFQFLDEYQKISAEITSKIKVVMLSTSLNPYDIEKSKNYKSVVKFLHKPLNEEALNSL